ncbi:MAG: Asp-tRNA(Asn)/Glu-tRNA(Gln) amidotransferase subunit GatA [Defluviitaleaceae bacterium]|nr:Asp-tRNA(Asn)/Glu-tRNA(Gln) amidotransferase subunit GatA [Defluviitaleaceae bacterium]
MELYKKTAVELSDLIRKKEVRPSEICESFLARHDASRDLNAYLHLDGDAIVAQAKILDSEKITDETPRIFGLPVAIKDNICTKGIPTTCASKMLENFIPPYDATAVSRLKSQGAVIFGKTNMDEFAMGGGCAAKSASGNGTRNAPASDVSTVPTSRLARNPHDPSRTPGGSSSGGAAAVGAQSALFSLCSDTGGSIRQPASHCGVVGYKPTYGAVSRYGLLAYAGSFDQIGPIARTVSDAALLASAIVGHDPLDSKSDPSAKLDFSQIEHFDMRGKKIGLLTECFANIDADIESAVTNAAKTYESLGASVEKISIPLIENCLPIYYTIALAEAASSFSRYDGVSYGYRTANAESIDDLYVKSRTEGFGSVVKQRLWLGTYLLSAGCYEKYFEKALAARAMLTARFVEAFEKYDFLLAPVSPKGAYKLEESPPAAEAWRLDKCTVPANLAGLPAISVPCGHDANNMPVGVQLLAGRFNDATLLGAARAFEKAGFV